jgi:SAM-dependent methyltransferase
MPGKTPKRGAKARPALSYRLLDRLYVPRDIEHVRRTRNLRLIPCEGNRRGGKLSYAEWAHVIGIFQTLLQLHVVKEKGFEMLDVGCGTGLLGIAAEPLLVEGGHYVGLDVMEADIEFCRAHYPSPPFEFIHFDIHNPAYAPAQEKTHRSWPLDTARFDIVTALSVWTHLSENDATFYLREVSRVLRPDGIALITFFILDAAYELSLPRRSKAPGRYHNTSQDKWIFDQRSYGSDAWFHPRWARVSEVAIAVTAAGLERLLAAAGLRIIQHYPGNWKETPGVYFQDVLILAKAGVRTF